MALTYLLFGVKLQMFREADDKTQPEYAQKIGISTKDYQRLEEAQHEPRGGMILRISARLSKKFRQEDLEIELTAAERDKMLGRIQR